MSTDTAFTFDERGFGTDAVRIPWSNVVVVGIRTTAAGPFAEDVFWQFILPDRVLELPGSLVTSEALAVLQQQLPGMDSLKIIHAMGSTDERIYRVWHVEDSRTRWNDERCGARFSALVGRLGGSTAVASEAFARLRALWGAKTRSYHGLEHLADCLRELDGAHADPAIAGAAELALWYHDAIYEPRSSDSEERSAQLLVTEARLLGIPGETAHAAAALVRATAHVAASPARGAAADLVIDIDLSILGRDVLRFMDFEYSVGEEYASVPSSAFLIARGRFLASFLAAPTIFRTAHFRERYEAKARAQIAALLRSPRYRIFRWFHWLPIGRRPTKSLRS